MTTLNQHLYTIRGNIRPDEALLTRIVSHLPEKDKKRVLLSPYVTYFFTTCVQVFAFVVVAFPLYRDYQVYRMENDVAFMSIDEEESLIDSEISRLENKDMFSTE